MDRDYNIKSKKLFNELAIEMNITDLKQVRKIYYAFIKVMGRSLKTEGVVVLPDWGKFFVKQCGSKKLHLVKSKRITFLPPFKIITFKAHRNLSLWAKTLPDEVAK